MDKYLQKVEDTELQRSEQLARASFTIGRNSAAEEAYQVRSPTQANKTGYQFSASQSALGRTETKTHDLMPMETEENRHVLLNAQSTMEMRQPANLNKDARKRQGESRMVPVITLRQPRKLNQQLNRRLSEHGPV